MNGYAHNEIFSATERFAWSRAVAIVAKFPETDLDGRSIRCHEVARVVCAELGLSPAVLRDGCYLGPRMLPSQHSWLRLSEGVILDPYAVGRYPMVQLVDVEAGSVHFKQYREDALREDIRRDVIVHLLLQLNPPPPNPQEEP